LIIKKFPPLFHHYISLPSKYFFQHLVLKHPQSMVLV
jgi:hypothetical protein